jgi:hypothetical protein
MPGQLHILVVTLSTLWVCALRDVLTLGMVPAMLLHF